MRPSLRRLVAAAAAVATIATAAPLVTATAASASVVNNGALTISPSTGNGSTNFSLNLGAGASCPGDSAGGGYRWTTFIVPASVDLTTLTFNTDGPIPAGTGSDLRQPLFDTTGSPIVNKLTDIATTSGGPGTISGIPFSNFGLYEPEFMPAGDYALGVACTLGPASPTQLKSYWSRKITVVSNPSGSDSAKVLWTQHAVPSAPTITTVTAGDGSLTVAFTASAAVPPISSYTVTATPAGGGSAVTQTGNTSPIEVTGLENGTSYSLVVSATNAEGTSANSASDSGTPEADELLAGVTNLSATPGVGTVTLSWTAPAGGGQNGYSIVITPSGGSSTTVSADSSATSYEATGLVAGTLYSFSVTPTYASGGEAESETVTATPYSSAVVTQTISVTRPGGALVLTQVCGVYGALPAEDAQLGFPQGLDALDAVTGSGTAPTLPDGTPDPNFGSYPNVTNPNYPTNCGVALGTASVVRTGEGAGQYFAVAGRMNQITVVDDRPTDLGWTVSGVVSDFTGEGDNSFSGSYLGWSPVATGSDPIGGYAQAVEAGAAVPGGTIGGSGLSSTRTLISAAAFDADANTGGIGVATGDARLKLLIPITAEAGTYTATLTITIL